MPISAIIMDAYGFVVEGRANTKSMFLDYVKDKVALSPLLSPFFSPQEMLKVYRKYRHRAFVDPHYHDEQAMRDIFQELNIPQHCDDYLRQNAAEQAVKVKEGVIYTLQQLQQRKIPVYILTDCVEPATWMKALFEQVGLAHYIDGVISSKDVGQMKPSPQAFQYVLDAYHLDKKNVLFGGHAYDEVKGAHDFGLQAVVCFSRPEEDFSFLPKTHRLKRLDELLELVP